MMQPIHFVSKYFNCYGTNIQSFSFNISKSQNWLWHQRCWCHFYCYNHLESVFLTRSGGILRELNQIFGLIDRIKFVATWYEHCHWGAYQPQILPQKFMLPNNCLQIRRSLLPESIHCLTIFLRWVSSWRSSYYWLDYKFLLISYFILRTRRWLYFRSLWDMGLI